MRAFRTSASIKKQKPEHFDFGSQWTSFMKKYAEDKLVAKELDRLLRLWNEMARENFEDNEMYDRDAALAELDLEIHEGAVRHRDYLWLIEKFDGIQLSSLVMVMAQTLYSDEKWIVLNDNHFDAIITNDRRSFVFDIINFGRLSAGASLVHMGDAKFIADKRTKREAAVFKKNMKDLMAVQFAIAMAEYHLMEDGSEPGQLCMEWNELH